MSDGLIRDLMRRSAENKARYSTNRSLTQDEPPEKVDRVISALPSFMGIPPELRSNVYEFFFQGTSLLIRSPQHPFSNVLTCRELSFLRSLACPTVTAVLAVSRQVREEAIPIFWRSVTFALAFTDPSVAHGVGEILMHYMSHAQNLQGDATLLSYTNIIKRNFPVAAYVEAGGLFQSHYPIRGMETPSWMAVRNLNITIMLTYRSRHLSMDRQIQSDLLSGIRGILDQDKSYNLLLTIVYTSAMHKDSFVVRIYPDKSAILEQKPAGGLGTSRLSQTLQSLGIAEAIEKAGPSEPSLDD